MPETLYLRALCVTERAMQGKPGEPIRFVASTEDVARDGISLAAEGWELDNYRANPVFLWGHDYFRIPPIGRAAVSVEGRELIADVTFDQGDEFARTVERKYREGFLNAVSVGFSIKEFSDRADGQAPRSIRHELFDLSAVPVPGDPGALMERQMRALQDWAAELPKLISGDAPSPYPQSDGVAPGSETNTAWREVAAEMVGLFLDGGGVGDAERRHRYNECERRYRRLGRTAPEFVAGDLLAALGPEEMAGLFLEGEPALFPARFTPPAPVEHSRLRALLEQMLRIVDAVESADDPAGPLVPTNIDLEEEPPNDAPELDPDMLTRLSELLGLGADKE